MSAQSVSDAEYCPFGLNRRNYEESYVRLEATI